MNRLKYILLSLSLFLTLTVSVAGQTATPAPQDSGLQACEQTADLAKRLQIENEGLKAQLVIKDQQVALEKERTANKEEQVQFYKTAYEKGAVIDKNSQKLDTNSQMIIDNLRLQLNDYKTENLSLRKENDSLRNSRNWRTVIGIGAGLASGYYMGNKK